MLFARDVKTNAAGSTINKLDKVQRYFLDHIFRDEFSREIWLTSSYKRGKSLTAGHNWNAKDL